MQLHVEPDLAIQMPIDNVPLKDFREKAMAACASAELLGLDMEPTPEDQEAAEQVVYTVASEEEKTNKKLIKQDYKPATYHQVKSILNEFSTRVVDNALQIRLLVTNKLIIDSDSEDDRTRLRALELLGKISDVGLFVEKSEVTITNRSTQDLVDSVRAKIQKLMYPQGVEDVKTVEVNGNTVDIDAEIGFEGEESSASTDK
jgi:hypothetical protein